MLKNGLNSLSCAFFILFFVTACGSDDSGVSNNTCESENASSGDIVGSWILSSIDGVTDVEFLDGSLTFSTDSSYEWDFFIVSPDFKANESGAGTYNFDGTTLTKDQSFIAHISADTVTLSFCNQKNTFSFEDDLGDRYTYVRNSGDTTTGSGLETELEGAWEYCRTDGSRFRYTFTNNRFLIEQFEHGNSSCIGIATDYFSDGGTFSIGESVVTDDGLTAKKIDVHTDNDVYKYDIYKVMGELWYHGDYSTGSGNSLQTRPTALDFIAQYRKVQ